MTRDTQLDAIRDRLRKLERELETRPTADLLSLTPGWWRPWDPDRVGRAVGALLADCNRIVRLYLDEYGFLAKVVTVKGVTPGDLHAHLCLVVEGVE